MWGFLKKDIIKEKNLAIPSHVAIIMDGNARWSKKRKLPTNIGHKSGSENLRKVAESAIKLGIKTITVYAFSSENWGRPKEEVNYLMNLLNEYLEKEVFSLNKRDIKIKILGDLSKVSKLTQDKIFEAQELTKNNKSLNLNVAFSYGSRQEIVAAVKKIANEVKDQKLTIEQIDEGVFAQNLYDVESGDPDLLIRTAGDFRISNFLLWQLAYTELYFTKVFWPDFGEKDLIAAIQDFNQRERRYGKR